MPWVYSAFGNALPPYLTTFLQALNLEQHGRVARQTVHRNQWKAWESKRSGQDGQFKGGQMQFQILSHV